MLRRKETQSLPVADLIHEANANYLRKARRFLPLLKHLPGVRGVAVCNSVALGTASAKSDIDLLIITDPQRLWVARVFCTVFLHFLRLRRHHSKIAGRFCLSFFVTETALDFEKIAIKPCDLYLAFWISSLIPVFGKNEFLKLARQNRQFVSEHAGIALRFESEVESVPLGRSALRSSLEFVFGRRIDRFLKHILLPRAERKRRALPDTSGTIISDEMLKFHNRDARKLFLP